MNMDKKTKETIGKTLLIIMMVLGIGLLMWSCYSLAIWQKDTWATRDLVCTDIGGYVVQDCNTGFLKVCDTLCIIDNVRYEVLGYDGGWIVVK